MNILEPEMTRLIVQDYSIKKDLLTITEDAITTADGIGVRIIENTFGVVHNNRYLSDNCLEVAVFEKATGVTIAVINDNGFMSNSDDIVLRTKFH